MGPAIDHMWFNTEVSGFGSRPAGGPGQVKGSRGKPLANHAEMEQSVRAVLAAHGKLTQDANTIAVTEGLFDIGMDSQAVIRVMLAIEEDLDLSFPDDALNRDTFCTIDTILAALMRATA